jgi:hypothetical protein
MTGTLKTLPMKTRHNNRRILVKSHTRRPNATSLASCVLLVSGAVLVIFSLFSTTTVLSLVGLSLVFWGFLLLYVRPTRHVKLELLTSLRSPLESIDKIIEETKNEGKGIYLPPKSLKDITTSIVLVPRNPIAQLPRLEEVTSDSLLHNNPEGLHMTPPGFSLCQLFEKTVGIPFTAMSLESLREKMLKLFVEDLGIADCLDIQAENNTIIVETTKSVFANLCEETARLQKVHNSIGCPFCSAIACALAKATGKPIIIKEEQSNREKTTTHYKILEE